MENKILGIILIGICIGLGVIVFMFNDLLNKGAEDSCGCGDGGGDICSAEEQNHWQIYLGVILISAVAALGAYLIFFEKSQKEIVSALENHKKVQTDEEKFEILLKGLDADEKKIIKAVKEQDGITQQTLRLRADMHKSKLSIVLDGLEKKGLIKREVKGKTKQVFLKIGL